MHHCRHLSLTGTIKRPCGFIIYFFSGPVKKSHKAWKLFPVRRNYQLLGLADYLAWIHFAILNILPLLLKITAFVLFIFILTCHFLKWQHNLWRHLLKATQTPDTCACHVLVSLELYKNVKRMNRMIYVIFLLNIWIICLQPSRLAVLSCPFVWRHSSRCGPPWPSRNYSDLLPNKLKYFCHFLSKTVYLINNTYLMPSMCGNSLKVTCVAM